MGLEMKTEITIGPLKDPIDTYEKAITECKDKLDDVPCTTNVIDIIRRQVICKTQAKSKNTFYTDLQEAHQH